MRITIDKARAELVLGRIMDRYFANGYPYNRPDVVVPQAEPHLPPGIKDDPEAYAYFLFCLCYFMSATDSVTATKALTKLRRDHPRLFVPQESLVYEPEQISTWLTQYGLGFNEKRTGEYWIRNAKYLIKHHHGSVLELIKGIDNFAEADRRIRLVGKRGFQGFQYKMVSMILYYLVAEGLMPFFYFPIPVDFHVLRITIANEVLLFEDGPVDGNYYKPETLAACRELYEWYAAEHQISPIDLCNAVWLLGKALCRLNPGNKTWSGAYAARQTELTPHVVTWTATELDNWHEGCGSCPVRATCRWNIPAADYYRKGRLIRRGRREEPTDANAQQSLFDGFHF